MTGAGPPVAPGERDGQPALRGTADRRRAHSAARAHDDCRFPHPLSNL
ncbi:MAG: hypothetical protein ACLFWF_07755 [Alphaproteobacteria bacterium]